MPIPESYTLQDGAIIRLGQLSSRRTCPIRQGLERLRLACRTYKFQVFLQGSYKNDTNLGGDSDVDVVVRLASTGSGLAVAALTGDRIQKDASHKSSHTSDGNRSATMR